MEVYNADFSLDTVIAICNFKSNGFNFYFIASALKINESTFSMAAGSDKNTSVTTIKPQQIGHLVYDTNFVELHANLYGK